MITGWLEHPEFGVNKLLVSVPRKNLKGATDAKPEAVKIYNDVDHDIAKVSGIDPPTTPCLVVVSDLDLKSADTAQPKRSAYSYSAVVGVGYYAEESEKSRNVRDGNYVLRAVMQSLTAMNYSFERAQDYRELNAVRLVNMTGLTQQRVGGAVPKSRLLGMVFADFTILDKAP